MIYGEIFIVQCSIRPIFSNFLFGWLFFTFRPKDLLQFLPATICYLWLSKTFHQKHIFFLKRQTHWTAALTKESSKWTEKHLWLRNWKCQLQIQLLLFFFAILSWAFPLSSIFFSHFQLRTMRNPWLSVFSTKNILTNSCNQPMTSKQPNSNVIYMSPTSPRCSCQFNELCPAFHQNTYEPYWVQQSC